MDKNSICLGLPPLVGCKNLGLQPTQHWAQLYTGRAQSPVGLPFHRMPSHHCSTWLESKAYLSSLGQTPPVTGTSHWWKPPRTNQRLCLSLSAPDSGWTAGYAGVWHQVPTPISAPGFQNTGCGDPVGAGDAPGPGSYQRHQGVIADQQYSDIMEYKLLLYFPPHPLLFTDSHFCRWSNHPYDCIAYILMALWFTTIFFALTFLWFLLTCYNWNDRDMKSMPLELHPSPMTNLASRQNIAIFIFWSEGSWCFHSTLVATTNQSKWINEDLA